jgi:hypothetical protein
MDMLAMQVGDSPTSQEKQKVMCIDCMSVLRSPFTFAIDLIYF